MIKTAANRFFSKSEADQINTLTDLLSSSGRRAINLLTHDQLFSAKTAPRAARGRATAPRAARAVAPPTPRAARRRRADARSRTTTIRSP